MCLVAASPLYFGHPTGWNVIKKCMLAFRRNRFGYFLQSVCRWSYSLYVVGGWGGDTTHILLTFADQSMPYQKE